MPVRRICIALILTLLCLKVCEAIPVETIERHHSKPKRKSKSSYTKQRNTSSDPFKYTDSKLERKARDMYRTRSSSKYRSTFDEGPYEDGLVLTHGSRAGKNNEGRGSKNHTVVLRKEGSQPISQHAPPGALVSRFFKAIGRLFGFDSNDAVPPSNSSEVQSTHSNDVQIVDDLEHENAEQEEGLSTTDTRRRNSGSRNSYMGLRQWEDKLSIDQLYTSPKETLDEDIESSRHWTEKENELDDHSRLKDSDDFLSEADLKDMVRLFRRLFSSVEKSLKEKAENDSMNKNRNRSFPAKGKWDVDESLDKSKAEDEEENAGTEEKFSFRATTSHQDSEQAGREELPDVRLALAEAERLNKKRDAERHAKFIENSEEVDSGEQSQRPSKYALRAKVVRAKVADDEEDGHADLEIDETAGRLPKSSPAYGLRKRLLRVASEETDHEGGLYERFQRGLRSLF